MCFSNENIHIQFIDDVVGKTIVAYLHGEQERGQRNCPANVTGAKKIGEIAAKAAIAKGITVVVFDRGGNRYHGKVKALADAAREAGLKF